MAALTHTTDPQLRNCAFLHVQERAIPRQHACIHVDTHTHTHTHTQGNQERGTAYTYVAQIKKRFEHEPQIYREFLRSLWTVRLLYS